MVVPPGFKPADLGGEPKQIYCRPNFQEMEINWAKPKRWRPDDDTAPIADAQQKPGYLYAISWDHQSATHRETIAYIGITAKLDTRFKNHPTADYLRKRKRKTYLSIGHIDFGWLKKASSKTRQITEELEHILIWALWADLDNRAKLICLPGYGENGGGAWHIKNTGHGFKGHMPTEIIYPWMLVKTKRRSQR